MAIFGRLENPLTQNLLSRLIGQGLFGQFVMGLLLFVPGTLHFYPGWGVMAVNVVVIVIVCAYFYQHDRELLARRLLRQESIGAQQIILHLIRALSIGFYVVCGLDHRLGWSRDYLVLLPGWLSELALAGYAGSYLLLIPVMKANRFAASIIQMQTGQTLADRGPYRIVRHPMYSVSILLWFWMPRALGSWVALPLALLILPILMWRLLDEEKMLRGELPGYADYCRRTRYRLLPFVW